MPFVTYASTMRFILFTFDCVYSCILVHGRESYTILISLVYIPTSIGIFGQWENFDSFPIYVPNTIQRITRVTCRVSKFIISRNAHRNYNSLSKSHLKIFKRVNLFERYFIIIKKYQCYKVSCFNSQQL